MNLINQIVVFLIQYRKRSKRFIDHNKDEIAQSNLRLLKRMSVTYLAILVIYFVWMSSFKINQLMTTLYKLFIGIQCVFIIGIWLFTRKTKPIYKHVQRACDLFGMLINAFIISMSVYAFPMENGVYFPVTLICIAVIFTFPFIQIMFRISIYEIIFLFLSYKNKSELIVLSDIGASIAAWIVATISAYVMYDLRLRDFEIKHLFQKRSSIDQLTGIANKATAEYLCKKALNTKIPFIPVALFIIDIDNYKYINDTYGHQVGDEILKVIAKHLAITISTGDILGRFGGDEFIILLKDARDRARVEKLAQTLCHGVQTVVTGMFEKPVSFSIGIAIRQNTKIGYKELFTQADKALYHVKNSGKNNFYINPME